jgi:hypothetical protein
MGEFPELLPRLGEALVVLWASFHGAGLCPAEAERRRGVNPRLLIALEKG